MVFVDVVKELLVILLLCFFDIDILVVIVYNLVCDECLGEVVLLVLFIVLVGLVLVLLVMWVFDGKCCMDL